ncbi:uncharacterized protein SPPG_01660 [Spizellomyces punctatus DAOM BR117]|uniref:R3H domain-containing protein n=1 Tax=Spizellomyces punctatus (strain DAOM BR117) TaxID=645134 RepID=A0A0L0HTN7_SPIPD|nr:uncharacterized protein SPPG_01660 [Spizellomyces punctatus DAOM BR117]KND04229.1 hypothetical protein SPPG_01660 [Spizellomyces punctatus DAOM BR117]|eukprot:XP_016612268.1 hypothetical protein SPPG_01660 [Spizellomyces punctatus DAOM BR117]
MTMQETLREQVGAELAQERYECAVCYVIIKRSAQIWSCKTCWRVLHLHCVKKWAKASSANCSGRQPDLDVLWRCPSCQMSQNTSALQYRCFCEKKVSPEVNNYLIPHSCGDTCSRTRLHCPHPCTSPCHPGPCPPCDRLGSPVSCYCGKAKYSVRCNDLRNQSSCGQQCGGSLLCGAHKCRLTCHEGPCPPCESVEIQRCYCGSEIRETLCGEGIPFVYADRDTGVEDIRHFSCGRPCHFTFSCGIHRCEQNCHPFSEHPSPCPLDPTVMFACACGKIKRNALSIQSRTHCSDPPLTCESACQKLLTCGHVCNRRCHADPCESVLCPKTTILKCRCGSTTHCVPCWKVKHMTTEIRCDKPCHQRLSCKRHECTMRCCPASDAADSNGDHVCLKACGRPLKCGIHKCQALCHRGKCPPCPEASFNDVACHCGRTVLRAPIPCNTKPPECSHPCIRQPACGHAAIPHPCHLDDVPCPPCPHLVSRPCKCGKSLMRHTPCHRTAPQACAELCGKVLRTCEHQCARTCHDDDCLAEGEVCRQRCKLQRKCGHVCDLPCNGTPCDHGTGCGIKVRRVCSCGCRSEEMSCDLLPVATAAPGCADGLHEPTHGFLPCNDTCAQSASIEPESITPYPLTLLDFADSNLAFVKSVERALERLFKEGKRSHYFSPMRRDARAFVHELCQNFYGLSTQSVDREPFRSVRVQMLDVAVVPRIPISEVVTRRQQGDPLTSQLIAVRQSGPLIPVSDSDDDCTTIISKSAGVILRRAVDSGTEQQVSELASGTVIQDGSPLPDAPLNSTPKQKRKARKRAPSRARISRDANVSTSNGFGLLDLLGEEDG